MGSKGEKKQQKKFFIDIYIYISLSLVGAGGWLGWVECVRLLRNGCDWIGAEVLEAQALSHTHTHAPTLRSVGDGHGIAHGRKISSRHSKKKKKKRVSSSIKSCLPLC